MEKYGLESVRGKLFQYGQIPPVAAAELKINVTDENYSLYLLVSICENAKVAILSKKSYYAEFVFLDEDDNPDAAPFEEDDEAVIEKWDFDDYEDDDFSGVKFPEYYTLANKIAVDLWTI